MAVPKEQSGPAFSRARAAHLKLGEYGELQAERLLIELGLDILTANFATDHGEIDIVAQEAEVLCFVEVKTRHRAKRARPAAAVGREKRRRIVRAAQRYLREIGRPDIRYRYDIVEVLATGRRIRDARYWRNAFTEERDRGTVFPSSIAPA